MQENRGGYYWNSTSGLFGAEAIDILFQSGLQGSGNKKYEVYAAILRSQDGSYVSSESGYYIPLAVKGQEKKKPDSISTIQGEVWGFWAEEVHHSKSQPVVTIRWTEPRLINTHRAVNYYKADTILDNPDVIPFQLKSLALEAAKAVSKYIGYNFQGRGWRVPDTVVDGSGMWIKDDKDQGRYVPSASYNPSSGCKGCSGSINSNGLKLQTTTFRYVMVGTQTSGFTAQECFRNNNTGATAETLQFFAANLVDSMNNPQPCSVIRVTPDSPVAGIAPRVPDLCITVGGLDQGIWLLPPNLTTVPTTCGSPSLLTWTGTPPLVCTGNTSSITFTLSGLPANMDTQKANFIASKITFITTCPLTVGTTRAAVLPTTVNTTGGVTTGTFNCGTCTPTFFTTGVIVAIVVGIIFFILIILFIVFFLAAPASAVATAPAYAAPTYATTTYMV